MKLSLKDYEKGLYEFGEELNDEKEFKGIVKHLIQVIYDNTHDITLLDDLVRDYERFYEEQKNVEHVWITTAQELDAKKKKSVEKDVMELLEVKEINSEFIVDSSIIGGVIIRTRDKMIDASIKRKLDKLKQA